MAYLNIQKRMKCIKGQLVAYLLPFPLTKTPLFAFDQK